MFRIKAGVKQGYILSLFILIFFMDFVLGNTAKAMEEQIINWGSKTLVNLHYIDDLSILGESVSKMNELQEVLGFPRFRVLEYV